MTLKLDSSPENNDCVTASNLCSASGVVSDFEGVHTRRKVTVPLGLQTRGLGGMFPQTIFKLILGSWRWLFSCFLHDIFSK